jgi:hypothetical protein
MRASGTWGASAGSGVNALERSPRGSRTARFTYPAKRSRWRCSNTLPTTAMPAFEYFVRFPGG